MTHDKALFILTDDTISIKTVIMVFIMFMAMIIVIVFIIMGWSWCYCRLPLNDPALP